MALVPAVAHAQGGHSARSGRKARESRAADVTTLKRVAVNQHVRRVAITISARDRLPNLESLKLYPDAVRSPQSHLCVAASGKGMEHRSLLCLGGKRDGDTVRVGVSRLHKSGRAKKNHGIKATLTSREPDVIKLEMSLRAAGFRPGHFRYYGIAAKSGGGISRTPPSGSRRGQINPVVRTGCSLGGLGDYRNGPRDKKRIALTFDDGPSDYTMQVLHILDDLHAKATFFEVGQEIPGREAIMRKLIAHGEDIGDHSMHHEQLPGEASMRQTQQMIESATGFKPCVFRPPYGEYNGGTVSAARHLGMSVALWDRDTNDWKLPGSASIEHTAISAESGSIVLMHDGGGPRSQTVAALPKIIKTLKGRGYKLVTLTKLFGGHYKLRETR